MLALVLVDINLHTKFELPSFTRSKSMMGPQNFNNASRDHDFHQAFRVGLSSEGLDLL